MEELRRLGARVISSLHTGQGIDNHNTDVFEEQSCRLIGIGDANMVDASPDQRIQS